MKLLSLIFSYQQFFLVHPSILKLIGVLFNEYTFFLNTEPINRKNETNSIDCVNNTSATNLQK